MPLWLRITIWVLAVIVLVYLLWFLYGLVSIRNFSRLMKRRLKGAAVLFASKRDLLLSLFAIYKKEGVEMPDKETDQATRARWNTFAIKTSADAEAYALELSAYEKRLSLFPGVSEKITSSAEFKRLKESLADVDSNYRKIVATFDSDLVGYDYWRKHKLFGWLFFVFGYREQTRLA